MKTITLPAGTLHLDIDDIADYMALSLWPLRDDGSPGDGLNYGFCYATLKVELAQAIESKELPARDPLTKGLHAHPYGENVKHALVRVDDLRKYVADRGMAVEVPESKAPAQSPAEPAPVNDDGTAGESWQDKARVRAHEIIKRQHAKDCYPDQIAIADEIANEFRPAGIFGAGGKPLKGSYIKRHALKGISSAKGKQLSTTIRRGK